MNQQTADFLRYLNRGGEWGYFWTLPNKATTWYKTGSRIPEPAPAEAVYFGVNPCKEKKENGRGSLDIIAAINCLFAEFDDKDYPNNQALKDHITSLDPPPSVLIFSGGGYHAYWLLDQPYILATDQDRKEAARIQRAWVKYTGGDQGAKDLARVLRLPGTKNNKYDPARRVEFESCHFDRTYTLEFLSAVIPSEAQPPEFTADPIIVDPGRAGQYWLNRAIKKARPGNRNETGFYMGCQLRDAGLSEPEVKSILLEYAKHVTTSSNPYTEQEAIATTREVFSRVPRKPARKRENKNMISEKTPDLIVPLAEQTESIKDLVLELGGQITEIQTIDRPPRKTSFDMGELYDTEFPEPNWAIPGLIPEGLDILGGRPKIGKSWLLMQIANAIGTGGRFFGEKVTQGNVLYIAFEDSPRRLKDRAIKQGIPRDAAIDWRFEWRALQGPGIGDLLVEIQRHKLRAVIIDTMTRGLPGVDQQKDQKIIQQVYSDMQTIALENGITFLTSDHVRKLGGYEHDPIDDIINTTSKTAIADSILALYKGHGKTEATLLGRGRDFEDINLLLQWDGLTGCWQSLGNAEEVITSQNDENVFNVVNDLSDLDDPDELPTVTNINKRLDIHRTSVDRSIKNLIDKGKIIKGAKIGRKQPYYPAK